MIEVNNVSKKYGGVPVIDDVSIQIGGGKMTSFIGPNGAGKSTLLSMISRLTEVDGGHILVDGEDVSRTKSQELARRLSILKQSNVLNVRLTARELVSFGRFPYSQGRLNKEDWDAVDEAIDYLQLGNMQHKYLDQLSGGQRQRAFIAMVLAQNTDYILLDEPLNNLDMKHSVQIMQVLRKLVDERNKTVVIVLHDINFASWYSDEIVALKQGRIVRADKTDAMMDTEVLRDIFDMDIPVCQMGEHQIGVYFGPYTPRVAEPHNIYDKEKVVK